MIFQNFHICQMFQLVIEQPSMLLVKMKPVDKTNKLGKFRKEREVILKIRINKSVNNFILTLF
jgi:hypothetical protein